MMDYLINSVAFLLATATTCGALAWWIMDGADYRESVRCKFEVMAWDMKLWMERCQEECELKTSAVASKILAETAAEVAVERINRIADENRNLIWQQPECIGINIILNPNHAIFRILEERLIHYRPMDGNFYPPDTKIIEMRMEVLAYTHAISLETFRSHPDMVRIVKSWMLEKAMPVIAENMRHI